jgi:hypothetical protein
LIKYKIISTPLLKLKLRYQKSNLELLALITI